MSANNPSTIALAQAVAELRETIAKKEYTRTEARIATWQETHSTPFGILIKKAADRTGSVDAIIWKNIRKSPVILTLVSLRSRFIGTRSEEDNVELFTATLRTKSKTPVDAFDFLATVKTAGITDFNPQEYDGVAIPYRLLILPDETLTATIDYRVKSTGSDAQLLAVCAITVSDA